MSAAASEPTRRQWRRRVEETRRHYSGGAKDLPYDSRLFLGAIL